MEEKLRAMEMLWDDICRNVPDFSSPAWHENILKEREKKLVNYAERIIITIPTLSMFSESLSECISLLANISHPIFTSNPKVQSDRGYPHLCGIRNVWKAPAQTGME